MSSGAQHIGKWHLGHHDGYHPTYRGFDNYFGLPYSNDMGCVDAFVGYNLPTPSACARVWSDYAHNTWAVGAALPLYDARGANCSGGGRDNAADADTEEAVAAEFGDELTGPQAAQHQSHKRCDATIAEQPAQLAPLHTRYAAAATAFVRGEAAAASPYFLYVAPAHMHVPIAVADPFLNASARRDPFGDGLREVGASRARRGTRRAREEGRRDGRRGRTTEE